MKIKRRYLCIIVCIGIIAFLFIGLEKKETPKVKTSSTALPSYPDEHFIKLASIEITHPRLPHPSFLFLKTLKNSDTQLNNYLKQADKFNPESFSRNGVLSLLISYLCTKEERYLDFLKKLPENSFNNWGFSRLEVLAVVYDWMYDYFDKDARSRFESRIGKECEKWIAYYDEIGVSPYNDVGYIRLGAGIFLGALAICHETTNGNRLLQYAYDVMFNKYLPVWKQIMKGGGWHEGGEYFRLGVGQIIVSSLSSWGSALHQDYFKKNPWLEDLIYYGIYTTRPDAQAIKVGDVARGSSALFPDLLPLSVIYNNPYGRWFNRRYAQYGSGAPSDFRPSGWPWVKPDSPQAEAKPPDDLPLDHFFEGLGMVVMRSGWQEDDVYATFKAGDYYWSHQHYDSGSFTIYKRGALAIDSGTYISGYTSGHHMKYQMQTIAHNCITVTDPKDHYPKAKIVFPNDGGQRRIKEYSPDDIGEWRDKKESYEMGDIVNIDLTNSYSYVAADITPAYNNSKSGTGDYRHRTHRVDHCERQFLFIKPNLFLILDYVVAKEPEFKKKWLLHSINKPDFDGRSLEITRTDKVRHRYSWPPYLKYRQPDKVHYQYNGKLIIQPLLPIDRAVRLIGGPGHEFDIDGVNYNLDMNGKAIIPDPTKGPQEPGAWRIEISPEKAGHADLFLNALFALDSAEKNTWRASVLPDGNNDAFVWLSLRSEADWKILILPKNIGTIGKFDRIEIPSMIQENNIMLYWFGTKPNCPFRIKNNGKSILIAKGNKDTAGIFSNLNGTLLIDWHSGK